MKYKIYFIVLIILVVLTLLIVVLPRKIKINKISCTSQYGECPAGINMITESLKGSNYYRISRDLKRNLTKNADIEKFSVRYDFPDKIVLDLILINSRFALTNESAKYALINVKGDVSSIEDVNNLPAVYIKGELPEVSQRVDDTTLYALNLTYDLNLFYKIKSATLENNYLKVDYEGYPETILPLSGDEDLTTGSVNLIFSSLNKLKSTSKIDKDISQVDLRFKNPVVKF